MARHYKENPLFGLTEDDPSEIELTNQPKWFLVVSEYKPEYFKKYGLSNAKLINALFNVYGSYDNVFNSEIHNLMNNVYSVDEEIVPEYNGNSHYKHQYANYVINISAGKGATISLVTKASKTKQPLVVDDMEVEDCVIVNACGKTYVLPKDVNLTKLHDLVTAYNYVYKKLVGRTIEDFQDSKEFDLFCKCEKALLDMEKGKIKEYNFNLADYISLDVQEKLNTLTEQDAYKRGLVENKLIPQESKEIVYPKDFNDFVEYASKISPIYKKSVKANPENPVTKRVVKISIKLTKKHESKKGLDMQSSGEFYNNL